MSFFFSFLHVVIIRPAVSFLVRSPTARVGWRTNLTTVELTSRGRRSRFSSPQTPYVCTWCGLSSYYPITRGDKMTHPPSEKKKWKPEFLGNRENVNQNHHFRCACPPPLLRHVLEKKTRSSNSITGSYWKTDRRDTNTKDRRVRIRIHNSINLALRLAARFCLTFGRERDGPVEAFVRRHVGELAQQQRVAAPHHRVQRLVVDAVRAAFPNLGDRDLEPDFISSWYDSKHVMMSVDYVIIFFLLPVKIPFSTYVL